MQKLSVLTPVALDAGCWTLIDLGGLAIAELKLRLRADAAVMLANTPDPEDSFITLASGQTLTLPLEGSQVSAHLGPELVSNGGFTGDAAGWTLGDDWSYGTNAVDKDADGETTLSQDVEVVAGGIYRVAFTVSGHSVGTVTMSLGETSGGARGADGDYVEYVKAASDEGLVFTPSDAARFTLDSVSVKKVSRSILYAKPSTGTPDLEVIILQ